MSTKQPNWTLAGNIGDATPLEHGGAFVLVDSTGVHPPELHLFDADTRELSRVILEPVHPCPDLFGQCGDNEFHPDYPAWWSEKLARVAECVGADLDELSGLLCSSDPLERAHGYQKLISYHGEFELDQCLLTLSRKEAKERVAWYESLPLA